MNASVTNSPATAKALEQALALHRQGNLPGAMERYVKVLQDDPRNADALYYVAVVAMQDGQFEEGIKLAQRALAFGPPQARVHNVLGRAYHQLGRNREALESFNRAIAVDPKFADGHGNRANLLSELGRFNEAMVGFDNALLLRPDSAEDWSNRGATLQDLDRLEEALASCDRALGLRPELVASQFNRAGILRDLGRLDEALTAYGGALEVAPQAAEGHLGRAMVHLLRGDWDAGFRDYEFRTGVGAPTFVPLEHPRWKGEPLPDAQLVLVAEGGLSDTIHSCRFAPLLAARGFDVTILTDEAMRPLRSKLPGVTVVSSAGDIPSDKPIRWLPLLSVPGVLGVRPDTVPAEAPYLTVDPVRAAAWAKHLGGAGFKIGINWISGHSFKNDIPLTAFAPLAALPDVRLISLQKGPAAQDIMQVPFRDKIEALNADPDAGANLFLDTAAAMMNLDLVVTCDTSVAHLAGALARPVFTALPTAPDWRWLLEREDTPWYPTMRLFRQSRRGEWSDVLALIAQATRTRAYN